MLVPAREEGAFVLGRYSDICVILRTLYCTVSWNSSNCSGGAREMDFRRGREKDGSREVIESPAISGIRGIGE